MRWGRAFLARYKPVLKHVIPEIQESKLFRAVSANALATNFAQVHALAEKLNLSAERVWNLDETGVSSGRDSKGTIRKPRVFRRHGAHDSI